MKKYQLENHDTWLDLFTTHNNLNIAHALSNSRFMSLIFTISLVVVGILAMCIAKLTILISFNNIK